MNGRRQDGGAALWGLALCFLLGTLAGQALGCRMPPDERELRSYLLTYAVRYHADGTVSASGILSLAWTYVRYPLLAALLGCASFGFLVVWILSALLGFFLSYSVGCFEAAFGLDGLLLAAAASGLRCLCVVPCFFLLAVPAARESWQRFRFRRMRPLSGRRAQPTHFWLCALALCVGIVLDLLLSPRLLRWAVARVLS